MIPLVVVAAVVAFVGSIVVGLASIVRVPPDRIGIVSGRQRRLPDGRTVGFRIATAGAIRIPLIETVQLMPRNPGPCEIQVASMYFKDNIAGSLTVHAWIEVDRSRIDDAVERFLGRSSEDIAKVASETLAGHTRAVAATITKRESDEVRDKFAQAILESAEHDLATCGIAVKTLTIGAPGDAPPRSFSDELREEGLLDIAVTTEVSCDVAAERPAVSARIDGDARDVTGTLPPLPASLLAMIGAGQLTCSAGRATFRWTSTHVSRAQLIAAARLVSALRDERSAFR